MKKVSLVFILSLILFFPNFALGSGAKGIAYVDLQKALNICDAGEEAQKAFSQKIEKTRKNIGAKEEALKKLKDSIEKKILLLSEKARQEKEREYQKELRDYQRFIRDSDEELKREWAEISKKIIAELRKVVERIGEKGNYTLIFEKTTSGILYATDAVDLTDELIKAYNEQRK